MQLVLPVRAMAWSLCIALVSTAAQAQVKVVRFLHNETDPPSIEFFNNAVKQFEAANPDIRIEMEAISFDARLQKVLASINTKTMPEVFKILPEERSEFARKGYVLPLDDMIQEIGNDNYVPGSLVKVGGKVYDVPYALQNFGIYWQRRDLLQAKGLQPATNWEELKSNAQKATGGGNFGFIFAAGKNRQTTIFLSQLMWSAGGTYFDKDLNVVFDNPGTVAALRFLKEMAAYSPQGIGSYSYGDMVNVYLTGKIAQDIYNPRLVANAASNTPDILKQTVGTAMPKGPSGVGVKYVGTNSYALASPQIGSKNVEAARKFLKFMVTGEQLRKFSLTAFPHLIPPLKDVQEQVLKAGVAQIGNREDLARIAFDTRDGINFDTEAGATFKDGKATGSEVVNPYIGAIIGRDLPAQVVQRVVLQGADPAEAAKWGQERMQAIVDGLKK